MCGRGMRLHDDKENCLLLDYGENVARHGCLDEVEPGDALPGRYKPKICASCNAINSPSAKECIECGQKFEANKTNVLWTKKERQVARRTKAEKQAVLSDERKASTPKKKDCNGRVCECNEV